MSHIVCVHSFRHGTGKSNLTANLAVTIARQGKRVGIIDADINSPGIYSLFNLDPDTVDTALNHYLWGDLSLEKATYDVGFSLRFADGEVALVGGSVYLIPSSLKLKDITQVLQQGFDPGLLAEELRKLAYRLNLDYFFIDTDPSFSETTLVMMGITDTLLIHMGLDNQSYQGTAVSLDIANQLGIPHRFIVVNQVLPSYDLWDVHQQIEEAYQTPVIGVLPLSEEMLVLGSRGIFCLHYPDHPLTLMIEAMAQRILLGDRRSTGGLSPAIKVVNPSPEESPSGSSSGISLFEVLDLPDRQRKLLNTMLRHQQVSLEEAAQLLEADLDNTQIFLQDLIDEGYVKQIQADGEVFYRPVLHRGRKRKFQIDL